MRRTLPGPEGAWPRAASSVARDIEGGVLEIPNRGDRRAFQVNFFEVVLRGLGGNERRVSRPRDWRPLLYTDYSESASKAARALDQATSTPVTLPRCFFPSQESAVAARITPLATVEMRMIGRLLAVASFRARPFP